MQETVLNEKNFMKKEAQEAKGQVPEHKPTENPLQLQNRVKEATKVSERAIRILGEQKRHERKELHSVRPAGHTKYLNV
jgi:hypothetical protein